MCSSSILRRSAAERRPASFSARAFKSSGGRSRLPMCSARNGGLCGAVFAICTPLNGRAGRVKFLHSANRARVPNASAISRESLCELWLRVRAAGYHDKFDAARPFIGAEAEVADRATTRGFFAHRWRAYPVAAGVAQRDGEVVSGGELAGRTAGDGLRDIEAGVTAAGRELH